MKYSLRSLLIVAIAAPPGLAAIWKYLEPYPDIRISLIALLITMIAFFSMYIVFHLYQ